LGRGLLDLRECPDGKEFTLSGDRFIGNQPARKDQNDTPSDASRLETAAIRRAAPPWCHALKTRLRCHGKLIKNLSVDLTGKGQKK